MVDSDDMKDHSLNVQELEKGETEMHTMGCLQRVGDGKTRKRQEKTDSFQMCAQRPLRGLQKYHCFGFTVEDLSIVYVKERANGEEKRIQLLKRNVHISSNSKHLS